VVNVPDVRKRSYFYTRRWANESRLSIVLRKGPDGPERVLVDPAVISKDEAVTVQMRGLSQDGSIVFYGIRQGGEDETDLRLLDTVTGKPFAVMLGVNRSTASAVQCGTRRSECCTSD
jgi:prolyl oligopeptidase